MLLYTSDNQPVDAYGFAYPSYPQPAFAEENGKEAESGAVSLPVPKSLFQELHRVS